MPHNYLFWCRQLIEMPVAIYETEDGYALVTDFEKFKPPLPIQKSTQNQNIHNP